MWWVGDGRDILIHKVCRRLRYEERIRDKKLATRHPAPRVMDYYAALLPLT